ncbi:non-specific ribonucleoside hydrolase RihC-like isoform X2 [Sycon ciliatum]|uniref:non-specific ribonucleoside hydrolase RihC-like isoform X2 n=1 Tax=Sycon ciliatum TaxID=27933 RepID=UPI0031F625B0|eukprot:scpid55999/ scgid26719/ Pyrimidine-specific ribonucleoside hydrolase RihA; Cytidine/uridine-specific hydrolase
MATLRDWSPSTAWRACVMLCSVIAVTMATSAAAAPKRPVIIDTDLGSYMDDTAAILLALQSPELDVKLIVTATNDTTARARIMAKYLLAVNRTDVPIGVGVPGIDTIQTLYDWAGNVNLDTYTEKQGGIIYEDGVKAMYDVIMSSPIPVDIIAIAPPTNFPSLLKRYPEVVPRVHAVRAMIGSIHHGYNNSTVPVAEYNARLCVECTRSLLSAAWPVAVTPLDTCGVAILRGESFSALLRGGPAGMAFAESWVYLCPRCPLQQCSLSPVLSSGALMDAVATMMSTSAADGFLEMTALRLVVTDAGMTVVAKEGGGGSRVDVALTWSGGDVGLSEFLLWLGSSIANQGRG